MRTDAAGRPGPVRTRLARTLTAVSACLALTAVAACTAGAGAEQDPRPLVVASTAAWAEVASAVAGDAARVEAIIPAGRDPHDFQVTPSDALTVSRADVLVANGGGYDPFFGSLIDGVHTEAPVIDAFALAEGAGRAGDTAQPGDSVRSGATAQSDGAAQAGDTAHAGDSAHADATARTPHVTRPAGAPTDRNEHVWFDLAAVDAVAVSLSADLSALAPDAEPGFRERAGAFRAGLARLGDAADGIAADRPRAVVSTEPVAYYLLCRAGISDRTPAEFGEAVEAGTDPAPATLARMQSLLRSPDTAALVYNPQTDTPTTSAVRDYAEARGVPVIEVGESPPGGTGYLEWVGGILDALRAVVIA